MEIEVWGQTDIGLRRDTNQDNFLLDKELGLFIVADGMGGHKGGEVASALAVQAVREVVAHSFYNEKGVRPRDLLTRAYNEANRRIFETAQGKPDLKGMGTTMVCCLFREPSFYIANVGDSRAYLVNKEGLWQLTEDHSLIHEQIRAGVLKERDIATFGSKNIITRSVGFEPDVACDVVERLPEPNEMIIMCSDGLSGLVEDRRIAEICHESKPAEIVQKLIEEAKKNGGDDNVTVVMLCAKVAAES